MILYKNEDNVLDSAPAETAEYSQISTGKVEVGEFVTDSGLMVPAVSFKGASSLVSLELSHCRGSRG